jgi:hypothetical protein
MEKSLLFVLFLTACANSSVPKPGDVVKPYDDVSDGGSSDPSSSKTPVVACTGAAITSTTCEVGPKGDTGAPGLQGLPGREGAQGLPGKDGKDGLNGAPGAAGAKGDTGAPGATGPQGLPGVKGDTGATGAQGAQGIQGAAGAKGADGKDGAPGGFDTNKLYTVVSGFAPVPSPDTYVRGAGVSCAGGDTLVSGGCELHASNFPNDVWLVSSTPNINGALLPWAYSCQWNVDSKSASNTQLRAFALCAKP